VLCTRIFSRLLILAVVLITTHSAFADDRRNRQLRQLNRHLEKLDHHHIEKLANRAARINRGRDKRNKRLGRKIGKALGKAIVAGVLGACVHHATKFVKQTPGGLYAHLDRVRKAKERGWHQFTVRADITGVYRFGSKQSRVVCKTDGHRVTSFQYN
jgi:hypothetical protein